MTKKIISIIIIICIALVLVAFNMNHYEFNEDAQAILSTASYTYEDTWAIVEAHYNDFDHDNFNSFMAARDTTPGSGDGYYNYVRSLGGVFTKYVDRINQPFFKVTTIAEYQEVALYTWGLMAIWGFDYSNGTKPGSKHCYWCNGKNGPFYPTFDKSRGIGTPENGNINTICSGQQHGIEKMTTCCNYAIETFIKTAGLYDDWESVHINASIKDLRVGDGITLPHHFMIVGEINPAENTVTFYDGGSRFILFDRTI